MTNGIELISYVDSDYATDVATRRSTSASAMYLRGPGGTDVLIDFRSKTQSLVTLSTAEAELIALREGAKEVFATLPILEVLFGNNMSVRIMTDSQAALGAVKGGGSKTAMKHLRKTLDVSLLWLKEQVTPYIGYVPSPANPADVGTKNLPIDQTEHHMQWSLHMQPLSHIKHYRCKCFCKVPLDKHGKIRETPQRCNALTDHPTQYCDACRGGDCKCPCAGCGAPECDRELQPGVRDERVLGCILARSGLALASFN